MNTLLYEPETSLVGSALPSWDIWLRCKCNLMTITYLEMSSVFGLQEIHAWARLGCHPNVVRYYSSWFERGSRGGEHAFIQLEKCALLGVLFF